MGRQDVLGKVAEVCWKRSAHHLGMNNGDDISWLAEMSSALNELFPCRLSSPALGHAANSLRCDDGRKRTGSGEEACCKHKAQDPASHCHAFQPLPCCHLKQALNSKVACIVDFYSAHVIGVDHLTLFHLAKHCV